MYALLCVFGFVVVGLVWVLFAVFCLFVWCLYLGCLRLGVVLIQGLWFGFYVEFAGLVFGVFVVAGVVN